MKVLVIGGISHSFVNFRGPLLQAMGARGHEVWACAGEPRNDVTETLRRWGVRFVPIDLSRAGMRPWEDVRTVRQLLHLMREVRPDVVLGYTIKPVIYGGFAARLANVPSVYSLITGLGYTFVRDNGFRGRMAGVCAALLYRMTLRNSRKVVFQNPDDMREFVSRHLAQERQCMFVNGSGVDLSHFACADLPPAPRFLMACRLLVGKGVREYAAAARQVASSFPDHLEPGPSAPRFALAGALDSNPSSISRAELEEWQSEGVLEYLGELSDVRPAYRNCSVFVLPSFYREGVPRTILEAMAMGRPIITTDTPGCRETVRRTCDGASLMEQQGELAREHSEQPVPLQNRGRGRGLKLGANGILVPAKNTEALAEAMQFFIDNPEEIAVMGSESLRYAEERYDVHKVNAVMLEAMEL